MFRFVVFMNNERIESAWLNKKDFTVACIKEQIEIFEKANYNFTIEYR